MNQKEIFANIPQGEWVSAGGDITLYTTHYGNKLISSGDNSEFSQGVCIANAEAACSAVNNTYGSNINPEKVPEMMAMLKRILDIKDLWLPAADAVFENESEGVALANMHTDLASLIQSATL